MRIQRKCGHGTDIFPAEMYEEGKKGYPEFFQMPKEEFISVYTEGIKNSFCGPCEADAFIKACDEGIL